MTQRPFPPDQEARQRILTCLDRNMLVEAAAGAGKTTSMVGRMVALLRQGFCRIDEIAAVTFTRKAAAELRERFQIVLEQTARQAEGAERDRLAAALSALDRCFAGTIHSFCARLLRERPLEAGLDPAFREADEADDQTLLDETWDDFIASLWADSDADLDALREVGLEAGQLRDGFRRYAQFPDVEQWPCPQTHVPDRDDVIVRADAYIHHMATLAPALPEEHGSDPLIPIYLRLARMDGWLLRADEATAMDLLENFEKPVAKATQKFWPGKKQQAEEEVARWTAMRLSVLPVLESWRARRYAIILRLYDRAMALYNERKGQRGMLNFQDLLMQAAALLRDKPHIRRYFRKRFRCLLVDEFQDTDPIQAEVMLLLAADDPDQSDWRKCRPAPGALFVVGDPKQSIYRFRRADISTYNQVRDIIDANGGKIETLSTNFRSLPGILDWVNGLFSQHFEESPYSPRYVAFDAGRAAPPEAEQGPCVLRWLPSPEAKRSDEILDEEAQAIARTIRHELDTGAPVARTEKQRAQGVSPAARPSDYLIITWKSSLLARLGQALQDVGVPCQITGSGALQDIAPLALLGRWLRAALAPHNPVALVALLRSPLAGVDDQTLYRFHQAGGQFHYGRPLPGGLDPETEQTLGPLFGQLARHARWLRTLPPASALEMIVEDLGLMALAAAQADGPSTAGGLNKALELLRAHWAETGSIHAMMERLEAILAPEGRQDRYDGLPARPDGPEAVRIMNLHKVKGLEAPVVFLAAPAGMLQKPMISEHIDRSADGVSRGYLAIQESTGDFTARLLACPAGWPALQEEEGLYLAAERTRLLYVAATRAGTRLVVAQRPKYGNFNPWEFFLPALLDVPPLAVPPLAPVQSHDRSEAAPAAAPLQGAEARTRRWDHARRPGYAVAGAKRLALAEAAMRPDTGPGLGVEWGTALHALLEAAMAGDSGDTLETLARETLLAAELDESLLAQALETVQAVMASDLWRRARRAECRLIEVPFQIQMAPNELPGGGAPGGGEAAGRGTRADGETGEAMGGFAGGEYAGDGFEGERFAGNGFAGERFAGRGFAGGALVRGVVDLAFREKGADGWTLVDYKTDAAARRSPEAIAEHYRPQMDLYARAWRRLTGEPVVEQVLYFTATHSAWRLE